MCEALDENKSKKSKTFFAQKKKKTISFIFYTHPKPDSIN